MPIVPLLPEVLPNRSQEPEVFVPAVDNLFIALPAICAAIDATAIAFNLNSVSDTSPSTVTVDVGIRTFAVSAGKSWLPSMDLKIASAENPTTVWLNAVVDSYTGNSLVVNVLQYAGTKEASVTDWIITITAPPQIEYENSKIVVKSSPGLGSTNTKIRRFTTVETNTLTNDITYADTAASGASFTVVREGWYWIRYREERSAGTPVAGVSINSNQLTTNFGTGITFANRLAECTTSSISNLVAECYVLALLVVGDVLRAHTGGVDTTAGDGTRFEIRRVSLKGMGGASGGGGGGAPVDTSYIVSSADGTLTNERVLSSNDSTITVDFGTAGQARVRRPAISGDVSIPAGSNVATIQANSVENNMLAVTPANSIKVNNSNIAASPTDLVIPVNSLIGRGSTGDVVPLTIGTGLSVDAGVISASGGGGGGGAPVGAQYVVAVADGTLTGERVMTSSASNTVNIGVAGQMLIESAAKTGDVTCAANSNAMTIPNNTVGNAKASDMPANSIKCNNTAALADPVDLAIAASRLVGRADTGNLAAIPLSANFAWNSGTLSLAGVALWDGTNFKDTAGNTLLFNNGTYTWAAKPAANTVPAGTHILIDKVSFGGTHKHSIGPTAVSDGTDWLPAGGIQLLCSAMSSAASPLATASGTTATAFNITAHFSLPASFFEHAGGSLRVYGKFRKTGADATASVFTIRIGELNSANNDVIASVTTSAAANVNVKIDEDLVVTALGGDNVASFTSASLVPNLGTSTSGPTDKSSGTFNTNSLMYVIPTAHCAANAAATHELIAFKVWWVA